MGRVNLELASSALVVALYHGDKYAAKKHGVHPKTIKNWRDRMNDGDEELISLFLEKKSLVDSGWSGDVSGTLRKGVAFFEKVFRQADASNPDSVHAAAGAFKILQEAALMDQIIRIRFNLDEQPVQDRQHDSEDREVGPAALDDGIIIQ